MTKGMSNVVLGRGSKVLEELMIGGEFCHLEFDKRKSQKYQELRPEPRRTAKKTRHSAGYMTAFGRLGGLSRRILSSDERGWGVNVV
jgi:hypothetical protein